MSGAPVSLEQRTPLREAGGAATAQTIAFALSLLTGPILARTLGDVGRGELAAVIVPVQLLGWIVLFGLPYAAAMLVDRVGRDRLLRAAWLGAALVLGLVSVPLALLASQLRSELGPIALGWFQFGLIVAPLSIPSSVMLRLRLIEHGAGWWHGVTKSLYRYLFSIVVVALVLVGRLDTSTAIAAWLLTYLIQPVVILVRYRAVRLPSRSADDLTRALRVGAPFAVGSISQVLLGRVDQVAMASTVSLQELGTYAVAATAAQATLPLARGIADTTFARQMRALDADGLVRVGFALSTVTSIAMALAAPYVIPPLFGSDFEPSVRLLQLLLPGQVAFNTGLVLAQRFDAAGRPRVAGQALATAAVVNVVLVIPVTSAFGPTGAAILTSACQLLFAGMVGLAARSGVTK